MNLKDDHESRNSHRRLEPGQKQSPEVGTWPETVTGGWNLATADSMNHETNFSRKPSHVLVFQALHLL